MNLLPNLKARASLLQSLRVFFEREGVIEVDTPLLFPVTTPDPYLNHLSIELSQSKLYLQSSPEFAMKQLLVEVPVSMFQICKAFRDEEVGSKHSIEFTMLEWYMVNYSLAELMEQCERLLKSLLEVHAIRKVSYQTVFIDFLNIDPFNIGIEALKNCVAKHTNAVNIETFSFEECLHLLFAEKIEKQFKQNQLVFIYDFPESEAALAKVTENDFGCRVAKRFEIYFSGLELANAYEEEVNSDVLKKRFAEQNALRRKLGKERIPVDEELLENWNKLPMCSGIALGFDRLLMLVQNKNSLKEINYFL